MNAANLPHITRLGLPDVDRVPFGMHACHFYGERDQLVAVLVPYFVAGLSGNERCLWITAPPLSAREAMQALRAAWSDADDAIQTGTLRILDFGRWYARSQESEGLDLVELWLKEEERALADGYNGLRITANMSFPTPGDWQAFMQYEQAVTDRLKSRRIVALCSYALDQCNGQQRSDVMHAHYYALDGPDGKGTVVAVTRFPGGAAMANHDPMKHV